MLVLVCVGVLWVKMGPAVREWWTKRKEREEELNFGEQRDEKESGGWGSVLRVSHLYTRH